VADQVAQRLDVPRGRIVVTPLGVDPVWQHSPAPTAELRAALRLPPRYLLFVGTAQPRKGLDVLLAAHEADEGLPPLVLAGPAGWAVPAPSSQRVHPVGYLDDGDLRSVVAGARALVLPTYAEGFGLPVLEALATGIPVVCSDVPALREISGGLATLVPPGDRAALTAALSTVDRMIPDQATAAARRAHASRYTWQACAQATLRAYVRACA
jgi:glycosyltransferase involved in cell wall biosynthesis